jgi:hypothetical protein
MSVHITDRNQPTTNLAHWVCDHVVRSNNTIVVTSSLKSLVQLWVARARGRDDGSICKHHLEAGNVVRSPTILCGKETETAANYVSSHSDLTNASTNDRDTRALERLVHVLPVITRTDAYGHRSGIKLDFIEPLCGNERTARDTGKPLVGVVTTGLDSKCFIVVVQDLDNACNFSSSVRVEDT